MNKILFIKEEICHMKKGGVVYNKNGHDYCLSCGKLMKRESNDYSLWEGVE